MIRINLAPPEKGRRRRAWRPATPGINLGLVFVVLYGVAAIGVGLYWWKLSRDAAELTITVEGETKELATLRSVLGPATKMKEHLAELQRRVYAIDELTKGQERAVLIFDAFVDAVPRDLWVTGFEDKVTTITVTGTAFSTTAVADLMANLARSGKFKDVEIVVSRQDLTKSPRLVTFEVTCRFTG